MEGYSTVRARRVLSDLSDEFRIMISKEPLIRSLERLRQAQGKSDYLGKLKTLLSLLEKCGVECGTKETFAFYEKTVNDLLQSGKFNSVANINRRMLAAVFDMTRMYDSPQEYLNQLVDRLTEGRWGNVSLRLKLLKQFIAEGNMLSYEKAAADGNKKTVYIYNGKTELTKYAKKKLGVKTLSKEQLLDAMDEGVFDLLIGAQKKMTDPDGKYGLIKMVNDLASGLFRTGGNTKRALYMFAMVFGMTFYVETPDQMRREMVIPDPQTDIETNLFVGYYCNSMIRFMQEDYDHVDLSAVDTDPGGSGINFKNYAEIVYLYYIARRDMNPLQKLCASNEMILAIDGMQKNLSETAETTPDGHQMGEGNTCFYRMLVYRPADENSDIFLMNEGELFDFLRDNYASDRQQRLGFMELSNEQNTAFAIYLELRKRLAQQLKCLDKGLDPFSRIEVTEEEIGYYLKTCRENTSFNPVRMYQDNIDGLIEDIKPYVRTGSFSREEIVRFVRLLGCFMNILDPQGGQKRLYIKSADHMSRTALLVLYYHYFNVRQQLVMDLDTMSFEQTFGFFGGLCPRENSADSPLEYDPNYTLDDIRNKPARMVPDDGVNTLLKAAYYQPLSGKNVFDIMTVFSSYIMYKA